jgi:hypothetical protein
VKKDEKGQTAKARAQKKLEVATAQPSEAEFYVFTAGIGQCGTAQPSQRLWLVAGGC